MVRGWVLTRSRGKLVWGGRNRIQGDIFRCYLQHASAHHATRGGITETVYRLISGDPPPSPPTPTYGSGDGGLVLGMTEDQEKEVLDLLSDAFREVERWGGDCGVRAGGV